MKKGAGNRRGFSLVEVNLAILLVSVGLLVLLALFPLGLRESEMAVVDTQEAMFADHVLSAMEGNALDITDWASWNDMAVFRGKVIEGIPQLEALSWSAGNTLDATTSDKAIVFPTPATGDTNAVPRYLRFKLVLSDDGIRKSARLSVKSGKYGKFEYPQVYYTEFVYLGM